MPKSLIVELAVPSSSRPSAMLSWLNKLLNPHRMSALTVSEVLDPKLQAQQLIHVLTTLENEYRSMPGQVNTMATLSALANDFDLCEEVMKRLPR